MRPGAHFLVPRGPRQPRASHTFWNRADKHTYAVTKDGKRFLWPVLDPRQLSVPITMVLNWPAMVKK